MSYESWRVEVKYGGVWTNITSSVDTVRAPVDIQRGRHTWRDDIQPSTLSLALHNADQRYTPGNTTSALALKSAQEIRVVDVVAGVEYPLFHGSVELPEISTWQKSDPSAPRDQHITVTAVDRLGRLERSPLFLSTLAEHVRYHAGDALVAYYPLLDPSGPYATSYSPIPQPDLLATPVTGASSAADPSQLTFATTQPPPGDDGAYPTFTSHADGFGNADGAWGFNADVSRRQDLTTALSFADTQVLTIIALVKYIQGEATTDHLAWSVVNPIFGAGAANLRTHNGLWRLFVTFDDVNILSLDGSAVVSDAWTHVAVRIRRNPNTQELWIGNDAVFSGSIPGSMPSSVSWPRMHIAVPWSGSISHLQCMVSTSDFDYTAAIHREQRSVAWHGQARQSVRDRVSTILSYAGVPTDAMRLDAAASTPLQRARLAGRGPVDVLRETATTERGLLFTSGAGDVVLHARQRRYNPPLAATVDLTDLEDPFSIRTDPPVNDMSVTRTGGGTVRAQHTASIAEFGVHADTATVDSAVDADPVNLALFTIRLAAQPRQRSPLLALQLRHQPDTVRTTILGRELGDRVRLAGLPATAPRGLDHFHIEGIRHVITIAGHRVEWNTGPVAGTVPGVPDPYPLVGASVVRAETKIPH